MRWLRARCVIDFGLPRNMVFADGRVATLLLLYEHAVTNPTPALRSELRMKGATAYTSGAYSSSPCLIPGTGE